MSSGTFRHLRRCCHDLVGLHFSPLAAAANTLPAGRVCHSLAQPEPTGARTSVRITPRTAQVNEPIGHLGTSRRASRAVWAHLESTTISRLESRQNPHAGKRALRGAAFPGCGLAELSSSARGARLRRNLVVLSRCARAMSGRSQHLDAAAGLAYCSRKNSNMNPEVIIEYCAA